MWTVLIDSYVLNPDLVVSCLREVSHPLDGVVVALLHHLQEADVEPGCSEHGHLVHMRREIGRRDREGERGERERARGRGREGERAGGGGRGRGGRGEGGEANKLSIPGTPW